MSTLGSWCCHGLLDDGFFCFASMEYSVVTWVRAFKYSRNLLNPIPHLKTSKKHKAKKPKLLRKGSNTYDTFNYSQAKHYQSGLQWRDMQGWIKYCVLFTETFYSLYDTSTASLILAGGRKTRSCAKRSLERARKWNRLHTGQQLYLTTFTELKDCTRSQLREIFLCIVWRPNSLAEG